MRLSLGYPDYEAQMTLLRERQNENPLDHVERAAGKEELLSMQREARSVTVKDAILDYITRLTMASRTHEAGDVGISPRGALFLTRMAEANAYLEGRDYVSGRDVQAVFRDVCAHRVLLKENVREANVDQVLEELLKKVENPDRHGCLQDRNVFGGAPETLKRSFFAGHDRKNRT